MSKTVLLAAASTLVLCLTGAANAANAPATHVKAAPHRIIGSTPGSVTLYDQTSAVLYNAISSQNFESSFDIYDDQAADDFAVPSGHTWKVKEVDVLGVNFGGFPANSEHVIFYKNSGGVPGGVQADCGDLNGSTGDNGQSYSIKIPKACKAKMKGGNTYWVSVIANQNFGSDSQWFWSGNSSANGAHGQWQNPGGGFGICPTWCDDSNVFGYSADLAFTLKGKDKT